MSENNMLLQWDESSEMGAVENTTLLMWSWRGNHGKSFVCEQHFIQAPW